MAVERKILRQVLSSREPSPGPGQYHGMEVKLEQRLSSPPKRGIPQAPTSSTPSTTPGGANHTTTADVSVVNATSSDRFQSPGSRGYSFGKGKLRSSIIPTACSHEDVNNLTYRAIKQQPLLSSSQSSMMLLRSPRASMIASSLGFPSPAISTNAAGGSSADRDKDKDKDDAQSAASASQSGGGTSSSRLHSNHPNTQHPYYHKQQQQQHYHPQHLSSAKSTPNSSVLQVSSSGGPQNHNHNLHNNNSSQQHHHAQRLNHTTGHSSSSSPSTSPVLVRQQQQQPQQPYLHHHHSSSFKDSLGSPLSPPPPPPPAQLSATAPPAASLTSMLSPTAYHI